ncbi:MAG: hypothetical protein DYH12_23915, partial [Sorangiineae bacterium PRO1]|nr:hypothetical protein [Sorangiineae bacterium PRO1]
PPTQLAPCATGQCWDAPALSSVCGSATVNEDFSSGKYNVHEYALILPAATAVGLTLTATGGSWSPELIVNTAGGTTLFDGQNAASGNDPLVVATGPTEVTLTAKQDTAVSVFVTDSAVIDSGFAAPLPADAKYTLTTNVDCAPPAPGTLLTPPNFDPNDKSAGGYYLLPDSVPPGLYTHKAADCSRGTKLLIDVIYTVATHWKPLYPSLSPLKVMDMNEGSCSTVNHATHDDGTHVDIVAGCATDITCADKKPKIALAKLFVDTGVACGILNNDTAVHAEVNAYFAQKTNYTPWKSQFMRYVDGHVAHFHVRVKKPDGTCN